MTYSKTIIKVSVHEDNENPIFGEQATHVSLEDDAGGIYLRLTQCNDVIEPGSVSFNNLQHLTKIFEVAKELLESAPSTE